VEIVVKKMPGAGKYNMVEFDSWFKSYDKDGNGTIDKNEFVDFVVKVGKMEK